MKSKAPQNLNKSFFLNDADAIAFDLQHPLLLNWPVASSFINGKCEYTTSAFITLKQGRLKCICRMKLQKNYHAKPLAALVTYQMLRIALKSNYVWQLHWTEQEFEFSFGHLSLIHQGKFDYMHVFMTLGHSYILCGHVFGHNEKEVPLANVCW